MHVQHRLSSKIHIKIMLDFRFTIIASDTLNLTKSNTLCRTYHKPVTTLSDSAHLLYLLWL